MICSVVPSDSRRIGFRQDGGVLWGENFMAKSDRKPAKKAKKAKKPGKTTKKQAKAAAAA
jgi:hypothetical protein